MAFSVREIRAKMQTESVCMDVNVGLQQGKFSRKSNPLHDPLSTMEQGKLGHFKSGNLGTYMDQAPSGGEVGNQ